MSAFPLDPVYNDFAFVGGNMALVASNSIAETVQELNCRLNFGKGEWFLDLQQGTPYLSAVMVKNPNLKAIGQLFRSIILATPGVASIYSLNVALDPSTRKLTWTAQIKHASWSYIVGGYGKPFIVAGNN